LIVVGISAAFLGWRRGAFVAVAGAFLTFSWHLAVGVWGYRRVMSRAWPKVPPIEDDDDW
jgi:hypothetical protein